MHLHRGNLRKYGYFVRGFTARGRRLFGTWQYEGKMSHLVHHTTEPHTFASLSFLLTAYMFLSHFLDGGFDDHLDLEPPEFDELEG